MARCMNIGPYLFPGAWKPEFDINYLKKYSKTASSAVFPPPAGEKN